MLCDDGRYLLYILQKLEQDLIHTTPKFYKLDSRGAES